MLFLLSLTREIVLRICRNPRNYDGKIDKIVGNILFYAIIVHISFAIWTFGNAYLFSNVDIIYVVNQLLLLNRILIILLNQQ